MDRYFVKRFLKWPDYTFNGIVIASNKRNFIMGKKQTTVIKNSDEINANNNSLLVFYLPRLFSMK